MPTGVSGCGASSPWLNGALAIAHFENVARDHQDVVARLHAIWGLGQVGRKHSQALRSLARLCGDADPRVRAQAAKVLGEAGAQSAAERLIALLSDPNLQVRFRAALALGKLGQPSAVGPIFAMLAANDGRDPFLRHAGVMGLAGSGDPGAVWARAKDPRFAVRMAVLLVGRRLADPKVATFLDDADLALVTEAARAINDLPIDAGTPALAKLIDPANGPEVTRASEPLLRRVLNANFRMGEPAQARAVAAFASDTARPLALRDEALTALGDWCNPPSRDRVTGFWRPLPSRAPAVVRGAVEEWYARILTATGGPLKGKAIDLFAKLGIAVPGRTVLELVAGRGNDPLVRLASLRLLAGRKDPLVNEALQAALWGDSSPLRAEARGVLATFDAARALPVFEQLLNDAASPSAERQGALASLAGMKTSAADSLLARWVNLLAAGAAAPEIQLDILEAARARGTPELREGLKRVLAIQAKDDPLARYRPSLMGGDAARGHSLFIGHVQAQCIRCHAVNGAGGKAGPDLAKVASRGDREYLLRSLIDPDAKLVTGYETVVLALNDGRVVTGVTKAEKDGILTIETAEGLRVSVAASEIEERSRSRSAMPKMGDVLSPRDLRDVVEYLSTLK